MKSPEERRSYQREWYLANRDRKLALAREYRRANRDGVRRKAREYRVLNRERVNAAARARKAQDREKFRRINRQSWVRCTYGLSPHDYAELLAAQGGVCAACGKGETRRFRGEVTALVVDHDHATGVVRSLLCNRCNTTIGKLGAAELRRLADYADLHGIL